ncbi:MAG TPA: hypothetical protein VFK58_03155 [Sphingomicrobium sp.]|nr:hypothetical protein [Sphingomicrobium sp.]
MAYYRLYFFDGAGGRIQEFREFEAEDDLAAGRKAIAWRGIGPMELWSGQRKVDRWDGLRPVRAVGSRASFRF